MKNEVSPKEVNGKRIGKKLSALIPELVKKTSQRTKKKHDEKMALLLRDRSCTRQKL